MSSCSTPKRKKTTWTALLRYVDSSLVPENVNLEEVLSGLDDADNVANNSELVQRVILKEVLGDECSALVESIIQSFKKSTQEPLSAAHKVQLFLWPPSKRLDDNSFLEVIKFVFHDTSGVKDSEDIKKVMFSTPYNSSQSPTTQPPNQPPTTQPTTNNPVTFADISTYFKDVLLYSTPKKEATGIPLVGMFAANVARLLNQILKQDFKIDMEFPVVKDRKMPGHPPACDAAVCAVVVQTQPLVLYEYKSVVDPRSASIEIHDLMEVLLQGYYCLRYYKRSTILQCLTDLDQWWYFKVTLVGQDKLTYMWYNHESTANHINFLAKTIPEII